MKDQREETEKKRKERDEMMVLLQKQLQMQIGSQQKQQQQENIHEPLDHEYFLHTALINESDEINDFFQELRRR